MKIFESTEGEKAISIASAGAYLNLGRQDVLRLADQGELRWLKIRSSLYFDWQQVQSLKLKFDEERRRDQDVAAKYLKGCKAAN